MLELRFGDDVIGDFGEIYRRGSEERDGVVREADTLVRLGEGRRGSARLG